MINLTNRRVVLAMWGKALLACTGWLSLKGRCAGAAYHDTSARGTEPMNETDDRLLADMKQLGTRVYSEEGIPMILACEDLTAKTAGARSSGPMNAAIAGAFSRYVDAWQRLHPDAPASDVPKLVELLAYRDFAGGGSDNNL